MFSHSNFFLSLALPLAARAAVAAQPLENEPNGSHPGIFQLPIVAITLPDTGNTTSANTIDKRQVQVGITPWKPETLNEIGYVIEVLIGTPPQKLWAK
ncbi:uncharacterized protein HRG_09995 [Hirsutella rhossiliensis]|uniref:Uncharacterized protein n=1 Tax=Hirsutella rhossiliensis TaxID=111463 RepID=A0A9P8MPP5_9HYPO|nr:uncharacterized protein HRG_09995 [Hirsutella rhossiliensis]KAH0958950.1 hypothetical protein HRG_09995 [Hirsutella rhossiliensis]